MEKREEDDDFLSGLAEGTGTDGRTIPIRSTPALTVSADGRRVRLRGGGELVLTRRRAPRLVLMRLVEERLQRPGHPLRVDELLAAGWPGERVLPQAGQSRVYVAVSTLRRMGLGHLLKHAGDGYLLDPAEDIILC